MDNDSIQTNDSLIVIRRLTTLQVNWRKLMFDPKLINEMEHLVYVTTECCCLLGPGGLKTTASGLLLLTCFYTRERNWGVSESKWVHLSEQGIGRWGNRVHVSPSGGNWVQEGVFAWQGCALPD